MEDTQRSQPISTEIQEIAKQTVLKSGKEFDDPTDDKLPLLLNGGTSF